jgi:hypothetical protein
MVADAGGCIEYVGSDYRHEPTKKSCEKNGGSWGPGACPRAGMVGGCRTGKGRGDERVIYSQAVPGSDGAAAKAICEDPRNPNGYSEWEPGEPVDSAANAATAAAQRPAATPVRPRPQAAPTPRPPAPAGGDFM